MNLTSIQLLVNTEQCCQEILTGMPSNKRCFFFFNETLTGQHVESWEINEDTVSKPFQEIIEHIGILYIVSLTNGKNM